MAELLYRIGKGAAQRAWIAIVAWLAVLGLAVGGFLVGFGTLTSSFDIPGTASSRVIDDLSEKLPDFAGAAGTVVFHTDDGSGFTPEQQAAISALVADTSGLTDVASVNDPFATEQERADGAAELTTARQQLVDGAAQLDAGQAQLDAGIAQADAGQAQVDAARTQLEAAGSPAEQMAVLDAQQAALDAGRATLVEQQSVIDASRAEIESGTTQIDLGEQLLSFAAGIRLVSEDGAVANVSVAFTEPRMDLSEEAKTSVIEHFTSEEIPGVSVDFSTDIAQGVPEILGVGEVVGVAIAAVVLIVMLGSVLAASFPIVTAIFGVAVGALGVLSFSTLVQMASVTPILGVMLGLAVGIDYSLFIVNRHRKQLLEGAELTESIGIANGTAGNAVVFAGSTVIVALLALNITGVPFLALMGTAGAVCVLIAVVIAITLTPALLGLAGMRVLTRKARARAGRAYAAIEAVHASRGQEVDPASPSVTAVPATRAARPATARVRPMNTWRAVITVVVSVVVLLIMAIPSLSMRLGLPDGGSEPHGSTTNTAFTVINEAFGEGVNGPLLVVATLPSAVADDEVLAAQVEVASVLAETDDVVAVAPIGVSDDSTVIAFQVVPAEGPNSESTDALVRELRTMSPIAGDVDLGVAGQAAINIDISESLQGVLPLYLAVVVGLSLLIMILVFRSILVPVIATGGFILSLFANFGAIVAVFQWGWAAELFGVDSTGPILSFLPVILIGILFGLAMDYQLFLASGMREAYVHGAPARLAVAQGFRAGRSVVIAAGLIMVAVFGGFIFSESVLIRVIGFGLAFGILVDAFVVRLLLMPALMHLIGKSAWWIPRWLDRILPNVDVEGAALERRHHLH